MNPEPKLAPAHWIKPIQSVTMPTRHIFLDTEACRTETDPGTETQSFRLASAYMTDTDRPPDDYEPEHFKSQLDLWYWVTMHCRVSKRTILWCHNLSYDVRISGALTMLPQLGWTFDLMRVDDDLGWAELRRGDGAVLMMCDLFTFLPMSLERIGGMLSIPKPQLPDDDDTDDVWFKRCDADVFILANAVMHILSWSTDCDIAPFRRTGASAGFAAFKHRFLRHRILAHDDADKRKAERFAAYCGRCEPWSIGSVRDVYEWDFSHAYAGICRDFLVPTRPAREWETDKPTANLIYADVHVPSDCLPVLPYRADVDMPICWPTGKFSGWWWDAELHTAELYGTHVTRRKVHSYIREPALQEWAHWVIAQIDSNPSPVIAAMCKQWARTTVGRFGLRYPVWQAAEQVDGVDLYAGWWLDGDGDEGSRRMMRVVDRMYIADRMVEGHDSCPQIMSYVMMQTRLRLLDAMANAGLENVHYMDTDGLLVNKTGHNRLRHLHIRDLRYKAYYKNVDVIGTKQIILDETPRVAGLPARARKRNKDGSYDIELWERFRGALETGRIDTVQVRRASWRAAPSPDGRRLADPARPGHTFPPVVV